MRPQNLITFPRSLHPGAWWVWALALAAAASRTQNPVPLLLILVVTGFVVAARRSDAPWARSYMAFLKLSLVLIVVRILFQALLSAGAQGPTVLVTLPSLPMPVGSGLKLGGVITLEAVLRALYEGLQLATILCCVGAANALGSARRLLRYVPGALYEIGVACVIALTFAPQLVSDAPRVRAAHRLRGRTARGVRSLARLAMPVLEGALERSVDLAAAMDSRGYGRTSDTDRVLPAAHRRCSSSAGCSASASASTACSTRPRRRWLGLPMLLAGPGRSPAPGCSSADAVPAGRSTAPTRGRSRSGWSPAPGWSRPRPIFVDVAPAPRSSSSWPACTDVPPVPLLACAGILVGLLPAFARAAAARRTPGRAPVPTAGPLEVAA